MNSLVLFVAFAIVGAMAAPATEQVKEMKDMTMTEVIPEMKREEKAFRWNQQAQTMTRVPITAQVPSVVGVVRKEPVRATEVEFIPIVKSNSDLGIDGFNYNYETANGIAVEAVGVLKKFDDNTAAVVMRGSYQYIGEDGRPILVTYVADETGFHAESDALPVAPEIPEAIVRSLEFIKSHPPTEAPLTKTAQIRSQ